ncbi:AraC family transcriptional regulator [Flavobacterium zepuense]|uniref:AraC family transcriptional regulator n=1 Tax=Flavobacterium zepuense TaxID=2593302 RepID=A0A552V480_9FLAO|nr:helix-turn-helix domain-containing protein [Flavobacterium zepuense]TRW25247.1 AraC family transcriptional regulator [Flavobacterium zepuense]
MNKGNFITITPKDELVAKHIDYYYFHTSDDPGFSSKFTFYPNYKHALTLYKNSHVRFTDEGSVVRPLPGNECQIFYSINTHQSFKVDIEGCFYKIGVVFNPLGINHFINKPLCDVFVPSFSEFSYFGDALKIAVDTIFDLTDPEQKAILLDEFFRNAYTGFDEPVMKKALQEILNSNGAVRVEELSDLTGVNRKTLLRLFKKHLCASVEEYKKLVMFRNALNYSQQAGDDATLTDVALYSLYYDQAHYIKHFKAVTHESPKALLSKLTHLGTQETYWSFED